MRCKACDNKLAEHEMYIREETGDFEDLCVTCRKASQDDTDRIEIEIDEEFLKQELAKVTKELGWDD